MLTEVPAGWKLTTLGDIATVKRGASPRPIKDPKWFAAQGPGWVRIADVTASEKFLRQTTQYLSQDGVACSVQVHPGDLIMSICGTIGRPIILDMDACIHDGFVLFEQPFHGTDRDFLYTFLQYKADEFAGKGQPGTQKNLNTGIVKMASLLLPPLPEQRKIATILSSVDEAIQATQAVIEQTRRVKEGLLQELLTKGIGHTRFKQTPIGEIPEGWEMKTLGDVAEVRSGIAKNSNRVFTDPVEVAYLRVANVQDGYLDLKEVKHIKMEKKDIDRYSLQVGDVLMNEGGDIDKLGRGDIWAGQIVPCVHQNHVFSVRCSQHVRPRFLSYLAESQIGKSYFLAKGKQTTNLASINKTQLRGFPVPLPPVAEQDRIVDRLNSVRSVDERAVAEIGGLQQIKSGLLQDLLTGKVRVSV